MAEEQKSLNQIIQHRKEKLKKLIKMESIHFPINLNLHIKV